MYPSIRPLPFKPKILKGISEQLIVSHYVKNYGGAARRFMSIAEEGKGLDTSTPNYRWNGLKREEIIAANSVILHERYFSSLGGGGDIQAISPSLMQAIEREFGSFAGWKEVFSAMGKALAGGSGWVLLVWSFRWQRLINVWAADHTHNLAEGKILLALDMYEHAYHMDFGADAGRYVDCFMSNLHWERISQRFEGDKDQELISTELISAARLAAEHGQSSPFIIDVRMREDFEKGSDIIRGADYKDPDKVEEWGQQLPKDRPIVVYCAYGFGVGKGVAEALRRQGRSAIALEGGIAAWHAIGGPVDLKVKRDLQD